MKKTTLLLPLLTCALLAACQNDSAPTNEGEEQEPAPIGSMEKGESLWYAQTALAGVNGYEANGVAKSEWYDGRIYEHSVDLNIEPAPEGSYYEGWLVQEGQLISTGRLEQTSGSKHRLLFTVKRDLRDMTDVVITLEPEDDDPAPAEHVAEGALQAVAR